tara:strand:- start:971 stop:1153 length:183 start_codon:yes stop_codon:yes gene_type:complete
MVIYNFESKAEMFETRPDLEQYMANVVGGRSILDMTPIAEINAFLTGWETFCETLEEEMV